MQDASVLPKSNDLQRNEVSVRHSLAQESTVTLAPLTNLCITAERRRSGSRLNRLRNVEKSERTENHGVTLWQNLFIVYFFLCSLFMEIPWTLHDIHVHVVSNPRIQTHKWILILPSFGTEFTTLNTWEVHVHVMMSDFNYYMNIVRLKQLSISAQSRWQ